jgi:hypothetical protein
MDLVFLTRVLHGSGFPPAEVIVMCADHDVLQCRTGRAKQSEHVVIDLFYQLHAGRKFDPHPGDGETPLGVRIFLVQS